MLIYLVVFLILLIPVIRFDLMRIEGNKDLWFYISLVTLILLAGLRYRVGGDTIIYMRLFSTYPSLRELPTFDFENASYNRLWYLFNAPFVSMKSFTMFQIAHAIVVNCTFFWFFRKYVPSAYFTAILVYFVGYFFYFNMEVLRESLSICVLLLSYPFLEKRRFIPFYLMCIVAMMFHTSSLIMLFMPLTLIVRRDRLWVYLLTVVGVIVFLSVFNIIEIILNLILGGAIAKSVYSYLMRDEPNFFGILAQALGMIPFFFLAFGRGLRKYNNDTTLGAVLVLLVVCQTAGMFVSIFTRFSNYLVPFGIALLVNTLYEHYWDWTNSLFIKTVMGCAMLTYVLNIGNYYYKDRSEDYPGAHHLYIYVPYNSVLNPQKDQRRETLVRNMRSKEVLFDF